jgi:hypothetical protein
MSKQPRTLSAKYARRMARAAERGLSRSQARGHPRAGESGVRPIGFDAGLEAALKAMRGGETLRTAAGRQRVSRERLSRYAKSQAGASRVGKTWTFNDRRRRTVLFIEGGRVIRLKVDGYEPARLAGIYWDQAHRVLANHSRAADFIRRWENVSIRDASGRRHIFTTDLNAIYQAVHSNDAAFEQIYNLVSL